jgi:NCS1 family nucleobase:cation symporter-1
VFVIAVFFLGSIDACTINLYGPALCVATTIQTFKHHWLPGAGARATIATIISVLSVYVAAALADDFLVRYSDFIQILLYLLIPWSVINLVDYYLIRKAEYHVESFFLPTGGIYGQYNAAAVVSYIIGFLVQLPFMSGALYTGFVAHKMGGVDIAWVVGSLVTVLVYWVLVRRQESTALVRPDHPRAEATAL